VELPARLPGGKSSEAAGSPSTTTCSISTGGTSGFTAIRAGSITTTPRVVGNHSRPSVPRIPAGWKTPLHSLLFIPSAAP